MQDIRTLKIIDLEIARLERQAEGASGLDLNDVKKLETLIKTRQLVLGEPTEITKEISDKDVSDDDILKVLSSVKKAK